MPGRPTIWITVGKGPTAGVLCCAGVQINIQTFCVEFFRPLVDHFRILRSSFIGIYALPLSSSLCHSFRLMSAKPVKISDRGVFTVSMCSHRSYTTANHSPLKTNPKISNCDFLSTS